MFKELRFEPAKQAIAYSLGREPQEIDSKGPGAHEVGDSRGVCRPFHGLDSSHYLTQGFAFGSALGFMLAPASRALEKNF